MNKKGEVRLQDYIFGVILFCVVATVFYLVLQDGNSYYGTNLSSDYSNTFHEMNQTIDSMNTIGENIGETIEGSESPSILGTAGLLSESVFVALKIPFQSLSLITSLFQDISGIIGVPAWIVGALITIMLVMLAIVVMSALLGRQI